MRKRVGFVLAVDAVVLAALAACGGDKVQDSPGTTTSSSSSSSSSSGAMSSSSSSSGSPSQDAGPFPAFADEASFTCANPLPNIVSGLHPAQAVDYLELRTNGLEPVDAGGDASPYTPAQNTSTGTECTTPACFEALRSADAKGWGNFNGCNVGPSNQFLVYSRGATVGAVGTADLIAFLGPVDTPEEARLVLQASQNIVLSCDDPQFATGIRANGDRSYDIIARAGSCPSVRKRFNVAASGSVSVTDTQTGTENCACGRRFEGMAAATREGDDLASYLAESAYLEAASVVSFRRFEAELRELGASETFLARARRARRDEIRHARTTARLARAHGAEPRAVEVPPARSRTRLEIALENAVEGCVRETFGALVAAVQARTAKNAAIRAAMRSIALDEAEHAALAHDVAAWLEPQLTPAERAVIAGARAAARAELAATSLLPAGVRAAAGLPDEALTMHLLAGMSSLAVAA